MKTIILSLAVGMFSIPTFGKIRTHYSNADVLSHVLASESLGEEERLNGLELVAVEIDSSGELLEKDYTVKLQYELLDDSKVAEEGNSECAVTAKVKIRVKTNLKPRVTVSELTNPSLRLKCK